MTERFHPDLHESPDADHNFIAFVPNQIKPDRDTHSDPGLAGFPFKILLPHVHRSKSGKILGIVAAVYEPDTATLVETVKFRSLAYSNKAGGPYTLRVHLNEADGSLEALKYKGKILTAAASGNDFNQAMFQIGLMGIAPDEAVSFVEKCGSKSQLPGSQRAFIR